MNCSVDTIEKHQQRQPLEHSRELLISPASLKYISRLLTAPALLAQLEREKRVMANQKWFTEEGRWLSAAVASLWQIAASHPSMASAFEREVVLDPQNMEGLLVRFSRPSTELQRPSRLQSPKNTESLASSSATLPRRDFLAIFGTLVAGLAINPWEAAVKPALSAPLKRFWSARHLSLRPAAYFAEIAERHGPAAALEAIETSLVLTQRSVTLCQQVAQGLSQANPDFDWNLENLTIEIREGLKKGKYDSSLAREFERFLTVPKSEQRRLMAEGISCMRGQWARELRAIRPAWQTMHEHLEARVGRDEWNSPGRYSSESRTDGRSHDDTEPPAGPRLVVFSVQFLKTLATLPLLLQGRSSGEVRLVAGTFLAEQLWFKNGAREGTCSRNLLAEATFEDCSALSVFFKGARAVLENYRETSGVSSSQENPIVTLRRLYPRMYEALGSRLHRVW